MGLPVAGEIARREGIHTAGPVGLRTCHDHPTLFLPPGAYLKLFDRRWTKGQREEVEAYRIAARVDGLHVPELLGHGSIEETDYLVLSRMAGRPLSDVVETLPEPTVVQIARQAGRFLKRMHEAPLGERDREEGYAVFRDRVAKYHSTISWSLRHDDLLPDHLVDHVDDWMPSLDELIGGLEDLRFVHGGFNFRHQFVTGGGADTAFSGAIDLGSSRVGQPMLDLPYIWADLRWRPPAVREAFMAEAALLGSDEPGFPRRALAWALTLRWQKRAYQLPGYEDMRTLDELARLAFPVRGSSTKPR